MALVGFVDTTRAVRAEHADTPGWQGFTGSAREAHIDVTELIRCNVHPHTARDLSRGVLTEGDAQERHDVITRALHGQP